MKRHFAAVCFGVVLLVGGLFNANPLTQADEKPMKKGVQGLLVIPEGVPSFKDQTLDIRLYEYDPFLADAPAKLADSFPKKKMSHEQGTKTELKFAVGEKLEPRKDRRYYLTVFLLENGQRIHIGEKDGKNGIGSVVFKNNTSSIKIIVRPVR